MKIKHERVYFKWYLSYIIILLIPIAMGIAVYWHSYNITKKQAITLNENLMEMVKKESDNRIYEINKTLSRLALDYNVQTLSMVKEEFQPEDQFLLYKLVNDLNNIQLADDFIQDIFVYFNNTQMVSSLNGNMSADLYFDLYRKNESFRFQEFKAYMGGTHFMDLLITKENGETKALTFTMSNIRAEIGENAATIGIVMDGSILDELIQSFKWEERIEIFILNSKNEIINSTEEAVTSSGLEYDNRSEESNFKIKVMGESFIVASMYSDRIDWRYIIITPEKLVERNASQIRTIFIAGLLLCVIVGFVLSYIMTERNYNPLQNILDLFKREGRMDDMEGGNEYQWLKAKAEEFFLERTNTKKTLLHNKKILNDYYIFKLLEFPYTGIPNGGDAELSKYLMNLNAPYNIVVLFELKVTEFKEDAHEIKRVMDEIDNETAAAEEYVRETDEQRLNLYQFIVKNIFEEVVSNHFNMEITVVGDGIAAIVNMPENDKSFIEVLRESIDHVQQICTEKFHFRVITLVGDLHSGMEGIHSSYMEAKEAKEYITLLDAEIIFYDEIKNTSQKYYYPMETEQKIINAIKAGESRIASQYINEVLDINCLQKKVSVDIYKCLLFDMLGTVMKGMDAVGFNNFPEDFDISKQVLVKVPYEEMKEKFSQLVQTICDYIMDLQKDMNSQLSIQVKEYINENYADPDLNISQTGFHFDMTPAYISSLFKKQAGESLLEYINKVRVQEAQRLLTKGYSVVETAQKVGFRGSGAFIRVFKKMTGITPGQMKRGL